MGLPYADKLRDCIRAAGPLDPKNLFLYWLLDRSEGLVEPINPILLVRHPPIAVPKGRPRSALGGMRNTRRKPSLFEVAKSSTGGPGPKATPSNQEGSLLI